MDELLSLSDLFQWIAKAGLVVGLWWIWSQSQTARDKQKEEAIAWRSKMELESQHKDQLHDKEIQYIRKEMQDHIETDNRIFKSLKEMDTKLDSIADRLLKVETVLEIKERENG